MELDLWALAAKAAKQAPTPFEPHRTLAAEPSLQHKIDIFGINMK